MKDKDIMSFGFFRSFRSYRFERALGIIMMLLFFGWSSCTDDFGIKQDPVEEDFTGITLLIPDVENAAQFGATRTDGNANTRAYDQLKEANFNTLYIAAVAKDGKVTTFLKTSSNGTVSSGTDQGYSRYRINLEEGKYRLYVVANMNRYTQNEEPGSSATFADIATTEQNIRDYILNFSSSQPLEPGFLPLACLNEDIRVGDNATNAEKNEDQYSYVEIPARENVYVYADLKYLCSKVRYTLIFDRSHSNFGNADVIDFHRNTHNVYPYATNIRQETGVNISGDAEKFPSESFIKDENSIIDEITKNSIWPIFLDRYKIAEGNPVDFYTETDNDKIREGLGSLQAWTTNDKAWTEEPFLSKRVWQGVTYLPENLLPDNPTLLKFPYSFNSNPGAESPRIVMLDWEHENNQKGIKRAMMYDVYALITTPDAEQWELKVIPREWTLQELAYELHGPYELIVENSVVPKISMEEEAIFWYRSDVPPSEIGFISPEVSTAKQEGKDMAPLFIGGVLKDDKGNYVQNENGDYLFHVGLNLEIPYDVIDKLNRSNAEGYTKKDIQFFHIVAGSLQKRIEIENLDLNPYLKVTPQTIIVDTRELYTSGDDKIDYDIFFETNVNPEEEVVEFTVTDVQELISEGKGDGVLKISNPEGYRNNYKGNKNVYELTRKEGKFVLNIKDIITGSTFWHKSGEYKLIFNLTLHRDGIEDYVVEKEVVIKVRPFSGSYVIHFRDNTKPWEDPHIYVYQDLTLPADLGSGYDSNGVWRDNSHLAGKIVGYIERNPSSGLQWNAAVQYVFSNNLSFRGWKGYGGPDINNPYDEATYEPKDPENNAWANPNGSTMGFVMFGTPENDGSWNYGYAYNVTYGLDPNPLRGQRYNYDVNFNSEHQEGFDRWHCGTCKGNAPDFNGWNNDRFYTGITMEEEEDGWWKYTLTGVAQSGRTMIIFANYHEPWNQSAGDYTAEDNRWPGDYESGLPLFDFEDNEGWFLFDGNTTESDQKFTDDKPVSKVIPHKFTNAYQKLKIGVKSSNTINSITLNNKTYNRTTIEGGIQYFEISDFSSSAASVNAVIDGKTYQLAPKNFKYDSTAKGYVLAKPLYTEFGDTDIQLFVKWTDHITGEYHPNGGSNTLSLYSNGSVFQTETFSGKEYGNYKYVKFTPKKPTSNTGTITFGLQSDNNFRKTVNIQDLPKYYIPEHGYYLINLHKI